MTLFTSSIKDSLNEGSFDWKSGKVFSLDQKGQLVKIYDHNFLYNNISDLDKEAAYFAVDCFHIYVSAFVSDLTRVICSYAARARKDRVNEVVIDLDLYFEGDPYGGIVKETLDQRTVICMADDRRTEEKDQVYVVGCKDLLYFVAGLTEEMAIRTFLNEMKRVAKQMLATETIKSITSN